VADRCSGWLRRIRGYTCSRFLYQRLPARRLDQDYGLKRTFLLPTQNDRRDADTLYTKRTTILYLYSGSLPRCVARPVHYILAVRPFASAQFERWHRTTGASFRNARRSPSSFPMASAESIRAFWTIRDTSEWFREILPDSNVIETTLEL
jgi:hypothetical protein